jgi:hypothetical protein
MEILFDVNKFLVETMFFSTEETGQYIKLLCQQVLSNTISKSQLISVCGSIDTSVAARFVLDKNGEYYNVRMRNLNEEKYNATITKQHLHGGIKK